MPRRESCRTDRTRVFLSSWYSLILHELSNTSHKIPYRFARSLFDISLVCVQIEFYERTPAKAEAGERKSTYAPWLRPSGERQTSCKKLTFWNGRTLRALQREWDRLRLLSHKVEYRERDSLEKSGTNKERTCGMQNDRDNPRIFDMRKRWKLTLLPLIMT